ncbi:MAG: class I SAM-dependent methyltransferase [Candidatus Woesearchaeota archaeon]
MKAIRTELKNAERVKKQLIDKKLLNTKYRIKKEQNHLIFPVTDSFNLDGYETIDAEFDETNNTERDLKKLLEKKLTPEELEKLKTAFDTVGDIAILEIDDDLRIKEQLIAKTLLESHQNIKTVLRKDDKHDGEFRTQKMMWLAGENKKETTHKENGAIIKVNVEEVYFSPRLSNERRRIANQVKEDEEILVMFSGCAPYPCVLSKNTKAKHITGIELNPKGHEYGLENIKLNKLKNVILINGDVKEVCQNLNKKYDRILMPLPKNAEDFLDAALKVSKQGTIIHFYNFLHEDEFNEAERKVQNACTKWGFEYKKIELIKAGQQSPHTYRICLDFKVE